MNRTGAVCLDLLHQAWNPQSDLVQVFEFFLPQLLSQPNWDDPLNMEAASLYLRSPEKYKVARANPRRRC